MATGSSSSSQDQSPENRLNFFRVSIIIFEVVPSALRHIFKSATELGKKRTDPEKLGKLLLNFRNSKKLYHGEEQRLLLLGGDTEKWDTTLFSSVLTHEDIKWDKSINMDAIKALKDKRNDFCHSSCASTEPKYLEETKNQVLDNLKLLQLPPEFCTRVANAADASKEDIMGRCKKCLEMEQTVVSEVLFNQEVIKDALEGLIKLESRVDGIDSRVSNLEVSQLKKDQVERQMPHDDQSQPSPRLTLEQQKLLDTSIRKAGGMGRINDCVLSEVHHMWEKIASALGYGTPKISSWRKSLNDNEQRCSRLFEDWLDTNDGIKPKSWSTLLEALRRVGLEDEIIDEIEQNILESQRQ